MLLCYSLVLADWQSETVPREKRRGYNVGALLVNKNGEPVCFELNCINSMDNATQHSEVRAICGYLERNKGFNLDGFTVYTTLEPCIMCAGMITMTDIDRAVFGQKDLTFTQAFERLAFDSSSIGGYPPYPRQVKFNQLQDEISTALDLAFEDYCQHHDDKILAKFLSTKEAEVIFEKAREKLEELLSRKQTIIYDQIIEFYGKEKGRVSGVA